MPQMIWNSYRQCHKCKATLMTELNVTESPRKKTSVGRMKKANLRIDMTPLVDLGFLLIAFFIFTTEISMPAATKLYMPHEGSNKGSGFKVADHFIRRQ